MDGVGAPQRSSLPHQHLVSLSAKHLPELCVQALGLSRFIF